MAAISGWNLKTEGISAIGGNRYLQTPNYGTADGRESFSAEGKIRGFNRKTWVFSPFLRAVIHRSIVLSLNYNTMNLKIPGPGKATSVVIISIVTVVLFTLHWFDDNIGHGIDAIQTSTTQLLEKDVNTPYKDTVVSASINKIRLTFTTDQYAQSRPDLRQAFESFVKTWKDSTRLVPSIIETYKPVLDGQFKMAVAGYGARAHNQLAAVLIDWFICMLALTLSVFSNILRDPLGKENKMLGQNIVNQIENKPPAQSPFSLSRTQLVLWITIIGCVYVYAILWDSRDISGVNQTALILMGISAGTFAAGAILDTSEIDQGIPRSQDEPSNGFFKDILSDSKGISIHRFQNLVWTLIAIAIYFYRYANPPKGTENVLPVLDNTILALTGISSATYLTLKTRENPAPTTPPPTAKILLAISTPTLAKIAAIPTAAANIATNGLSKAIITISDQSGNPTHPIPDPAVPNFGFIASDMKPGAYTITVNWTDDTAPAPPPAAFVMTQTWQGPIDNTTAMSIKITL
jgi:hypothetical protein